MGENAWVVAVCVDARHRFSKQPVVLARAVEGYGLEGDAHAGATVQHRFHVRRNPGAPNLRQVHLLPEELFIELRDQGFFLRPGEMGENITTRGLDLLHLPAGTRLGLGPEAVVELTGLRNPCSQIDRFRPGLLKAVLDRDHAGQLIRKAGVMAVVRQGGPIRPGDRISVALPPLPRRLLEPV